MKRAALLSMAVVCAAVFLFLASGNLMAQVRSGAVPDMPDNPWAEQAIAGETMISEAQQTIDRCNQQIAAAERMKRRAQEGRAKAQVAGGTSRAAAGGASDQPNYPWLSMEQAADQMIADARRTIDRCELQIKYGQKMKQDALMEMERWGR
jgi:hypothetical protein